MRKKYNTPKRDQVIKTRLTKEEKDAFEEKCRLLRTNKSDFIRDVISLGRFNAKIYLSGASEEMLNAVSKLTASFGKIGGNLNQIALRLNTGVRADEQLRSEVKTALSDLEKLRFETQKIIGEAYGNHQTYQL